MIKKFCFLKGISNKNAVIPALSSILLFFSGSIFAAGELRIEKAEKVGMSGERLARVSEMASRHVEKGHYPGVVTMVARRGKVVHLDAVGNMGLVDQRPIQTDTLFRIYSMTKPITAIAAMMLYEEGKFGLDDPVHEYLPEFKDQKVWVDGKTVPAVSAMTMRQLFTHTAGLTYGFTPDNPIDIAYNEQNILNTKDSNEFLEKVSALPLRFQPGTRYHYSVSVDVLGAAIERISGVSLEEFFRVRLFEPLGMKDTFFNVPADKLDRLAGDHFYDVKNAKVFPVPTDKQRNFKDNGMFSGGGGLVSTASDYMRFCQMVLNGGEYNGNRFLSPKIVEYLSLNHLTPEVRAEGQDDYPDLALSKGQSMGLGFGVVTNPALMPASSTKGEISWGGAAGTKFWIDPQEELIAIALVQLYQAPWPLRSDMKAATHQAILELNSRAGK